VLLILMQMHGVCSAQLLYLPMPIGNGQHSPYWTWNPSYLGTLGSLSGGNLILTAAGGGNSVAIATLPGGTTGKSGADYYFEVTINSLGNNQSIGLENSLSANLNLHMGEDSHGYGYYSLGGSTAAGKWLANPSPNFTPPPADNFNAGDVVGILFKGSTNQMVMYRLSAGTTTLEATISIPAGAYYPAMSIDGGSSTANFGLSLWQLSGAPFGGSPWKN
jgi:hypothetical protein